ncbi:cerebellar degeneration-related protein 2-like [Osmerus mordax]|uniref:cerebellar degeneration-related protein 2-like n=1 Tax=Osmerus mordax TaxID=8014 RepID=UPI00350F513C
MMMMMMKDLTFRLLYLTKQVDLQRHVNDQHAKVYEQLDQAARELEQSNTRLGLENRAAHIKTQGLADTVESLQAQMEEIQHQAEALKTAPAHAGRPRSEPGRPHSAQSLSCLTELQLKHRYSDSYDTDDLSDDLCLPSDLSWREEEQASLRRSLRSLQTQLANERARREEAEREADLLANENASLEQRLGKMEGCQARLAELECEAEELRQLWRADYTSKAGSKVTLTLMPDVVFFPPEEETGMEEKEGGSEGELLEVKGRGALKRCNSEKILRGGSQGPGGVTGQGDHERSCVRRSEVVTRRGISLLNEVDAQYSALQVKYDELLRRCHQGEPDQTAQTPSRALLPCPATFSLGQAEGEEMEGLDEDFHQPEYKALFKEIFTCIQKTKEDLSENRQKPW